MSNTPLRPERILQFGTGILLRGLPDYFVDRANATGAYDGAIVVVKSTAGPVPDLSKGFKTYVRGMREGEAIEEEFVNQSIARVLSADADWNQVLEAGRSPDVSVIVSNTTEAGLALVPESVFQSPPRSFPARLTAILFERFHAHGDASGKLLVIPTELIPENGAALREMVMEQTRFNELGSSFITWLNDHVKFCSSLVDRIVTKPSKFIQQNAGDDPNAIQTEPYRLWAIEGDDEVMRLLPFASAAPGIVVAHDISYYRERKLRLLNGTHTLMACHGFLSGCDTVRQCMADSQLRAFVISVMKQEILPRLTLGTGNENLRFADEVIDRFDNPFTEHKLLSIAFQSTLKMKMRVVPVLMSYAGTDEFPDQMTKAFAAYLRFMKVTKEGETFFGSRNGGRYPVTDDAADYFHTVWQRGADIPALVQRICSNASLWGTDLTRLPGFQERLVYHLGAIMSLADNPAQA